MPPVVALPSAAASVANRFALRRSSSNVSVCGEAVTFEVVAIQSMSARLESRLVVS
jgi:hypothetical protein